MKIIVQCMLDLILLFEIIFKNIIMKNKKKFKYIIASLLVVVFIISSGFNNNRLGNPKDGKVIYKKNCSVCHRKNGKGIPNTFPPLAKSDYLTNHSKEDIISIVLKGQKGKLKVNGKTYNNVMLPLKHLSNEDIAAVLTYISNNFGNKGSNYTPIEIEQVRSSNKIK